MAMRWLLSCLALLAASGALRHRMSVGKNFEAFVPPAPRPAASSALRSSPAVGRGRSFRAACGAFPGGGI